MRLNHCKIAQGDNQIESGEAIGANIAAKQAEGDANRATTVATTEATLENEAILLIRLMSV